MRVDIQTLELRIQELEEENLQLKGELDERSTCEDKQMDEQYIDELRGQVKCLRIQRDKLHLALSRTLQDLSDAQDLCAAQEVMLQDLCVEVEYQRKQRVEVV